MRGIKASKVVIVMFSVLLCTSIHGFAGSGSKVANRIPLFANFSEKKVAVSAGKIAATQASQVSVAARASRIAIVAINPEAIDAQIIAPGDLLAVDLFDNKSIKAKIDKVEVVNKVTKVRGKIKGTKHGFIITTIEDNKVLTIVELPEEGYQYKIIYDNDLNDHILYKTKLEDLDILEGEPSLIPPVQFNDVSSPLNADISAPLTDDPATVDVMVVYTPAAAAWAENNATSINNVISQAMERAQLALDNSDIFINMRLVHSEELDYTEDGDMGIDLDRLTYTDGHEDDPDGHMDEVHSLRTQYGADIVTLFVVPDAGGGIAWVLQQQSGRADYAFNVVRVQQAHTGFTHIHEMGHNMGASHHKDQTTQPGPTSWYDWAANTWSAGWRWVDSDDSSRYCSIMTYESGSYFGDGLSHTRVPHFANPDIDYLGEPTGDSVDGDNARTLREVRDVIAGYRATVASCSDDSDCDNRDFCDGIETCTGGICVNGPAPCDAAACDEATDSCTSGYWIHWDDSILRGASGWIGGGTMSVASHWQPEDIPGGGTITTMRIGVYSAPSNAVVQIWQGSDLSNMGNPQYSQAFTPVAQTINEIVLDTPYLIDASQELLIGWSATHINGEYPCARDASAEANQQGNLRFNGGTWQNYPNGDWIIHAYLEGVCLSDDDCTLEQPYCVADTCVECIVDEDCAEDYACVDNACELTNDPPIFLTEPRWPYGYWPVLSSDPANPDEPQSEHMLFFAYDDDGVGCQIAPTLNWLYRPVELQAGGSVLPLGDWSIEVPSWKFMYWVLIEEPTIAATTGPGFFEFKMSVTDCLGQTTDSEGFYGKRYYFQVN